MVGISLHGYVKLKRDFIGLFSRLKKAGWKTDLIIENRNEHIEAITHEIAHLVTLGYDIAVCSQSDVNGLIEEATCYSDPRRAAISKDKNEFEASATTKIVLHRLKIFDQDYMILDNLSMNLRENFRENFQYKYEYFDFLEQKCIRVANHKKIQRCADIIMNYYKQICLNE